VTIPTPPGYKKNYVATTMMTGYKIKNRLLRSAKVGIFI
jgi:molecular chaperone GrpE (heat shock protein)